MATYRRALTKGATYFFTVNTHQRHAVLTAPPVYQALKESIRLVKQTRPFAIEAFVLLPDHLHCIWTLPENDADYATRWNIIKRLVSQETRGLVPGEGNRSRAKRRELGLWQRLFWEHEIRDESDFERHVDYIHWNPVKHGYVRAVCDWPYSSFHRFVEKDLVPRDWAGCDIDGGDYGELL